MAVRTHQIFPPRYNEEILKYQELIKRLLVEYDVIIFMARKAICFYKSMLANKELPSQNDCVVLSSRVLTYNIAADLRNKKVAVVDDVVIKGISLIGALDILDEMNVTADVYVAACTEDFINENRSKLQTCLKGSYVTLSGINTYQLSQYITEYIEASMCPNNIDQPIYQISFENNEALKSFLKLFKFADITTSKQKQFNIKSYVIHFSVDSDEAFYYPDINMSFIDFVKIRLLFEADGDRLIVIPFVLLSEITYDHLDECYGKIVTEGVNDFLYNTNEKRFYENKLKYIHYYLAACLMMSFSSVFPENSHFSRLDSNDNYTFSCNILELAQEVHFQELHSLTVYEKFINGDSFKFNSYLGLAYDYLYSYEREETAYTNLENLVINDDIITLSHFRRCLAESVENFDELVFSNIIDILIDRGILIPSIVHHGEAIVRAYKCGEIYKLTTEHFKLFVYMLGHYSKRLDRPLYKTELEKLCVLFFKKMENEHYLKPPEKGARHTDEYSICYSKFGPRVSTSKPIYSANKDSVLAAKLINDDLISITVWKDPRGIPREMYKVEYHGYNSPKDETWDVTATRFAIQYSKLYKAYTAISMEIRNTYIYSHLEFLIMLSIGLNKKNQLLSLLAELYLFQNIDLNKQSDIRDVLSDLNRIVDGLTSGTWKYMCYSKKTHPLRDVYEKMLELDEDMILTFDLDAALDKGDRVNSLIKESGELIYQILYTIYFLCKKYKVDYAIDVQNNKKGEYYYFRYSRMRKRRKDIEREVTGSELNQSKDLQLLIELQKCAVQCIEKFDMEELPMSKRFKIAFSFAGEHREFVEQVVETIRLSGFTREELLYDRYHEDIFSRRDLDTYLYNLYSKDSELVVVFLSGEYNDKSWTKTEYRSIRKLLNETSDNDLVMLVGLDKSEIDGLSHLTDGFVDASRHTPASLAELILRRYERISFR